MEKTFGKCALCGQEGELTFEHIPPNAAFNNKPIRSVSGDQIINDKGRMPWDTSGLKYKHQQRGMGIYSLCNLCNRNTGRWYGTTYKLMARAGHELLSKPIPQGNDVVRINNIYPLRFVKQVVSMFCSINSNYNNLASLQQFVLEKEQRGLNNKDYKICMYFTRSNYMKYAPLTTLLFGTVYDSIAISVSEITAYPLGFLLYIDPIPQNDYKGIDITAFSEFDYNEKVSIEMPICIYEMNDLFPTFYRSKEEIINTTKQQEEWKVINAK